MDHYERLGKWAIALAVIIAVVFMAVISYEPFATSLSAAVTTAFGHGDVPPEEGRTLTEKHEEAYTNRLIHETSPYLLQHAHNPVDWYPWGEEALARAKAEDKPIFLSIGYSACHWCHVMERESFENEAIAAFLNKHFVSIKVDREERPDLDEIYMTAVQIMTGQGGWPMTVFLTPDLKPFFGGTYFPPEDRYGRPGFKNVILSIAAAWQEKRDEIIKGSEQLTEYVRRSTAVQMPRAAVLSGAQLTMAVETLKRDFDPVYGGSGGAPKFPSGPSITVLLRQYARTGDESLLEMVTLTLKKMASGGIYDHVGGGFHRYSVDEQWLVPHFEKMLYDNAQLSQAYLEAYQVTGDPFFRRVATEIFDYELRDMRDELGGFYSTEDADSEGEEGKFYLWTRAEIMSVLGDEDGSLFCTYYSVREDGNFSSHEPYHRGRNILHIAPSPEALAEEAGPNVDQLEGRLKEMRARLLAVRSARVRPGRDDKILASWNALMIASLAQAYQIFRDERYREAAENTADFILTHMMRDGELLRSYRNGKSRHAAYLDDYAFMAVALIDLYEATFNLKWLITAENLANDMIDKFWDPEEGGFFFTSDAHKNLIARTKPAYDGAEPSGNSMAALGLLRLAKLMDNSDYYGKAERILTINSENISSSPRGFLKMLCALDFYLNPPKEIAIAGTPGSPGVNALLETLYRYFIPNKVVALVDPANGDTGPLEDKIPLLAAKRLVSGRATAYVCKDFSCKQPVTTPERFVEALGVGSRAGV